MELPRRFRGPSASSAPTRPKRSGGRRVAPWPHPLDKHFTVPALRSAFERLHAAAEAQKLAVAEEPLFALKGDPNEDPPHKWEYEAILPIRGAAKGDDELKVIRVQGGMHIATLTPRGVGDLRNLYVYLFGKFMPAHKQQLMRPYILHRVIAGLDKDDLDGLGISVFVPAVLSIKPVPVPGESAEA